LGEFSPVGRLFTLNSFRENYRNSTNTLGYFFHGKICALIFTRNGLGYILGDFFTNASGHPGCVYYLVGKEFKSILNKINFKAE
jgi:hypothetical protein